MWSTNQPGPSRIAFAFLAAAAVRGGPAPVAAGSFVLVGLWHVQHCQFIFASFPYHYHIVLIPAAKPLPRILVVGNV